MDHWQKGAESVDSVIEEATEPNPPWLTDDLEDWFRENGLDCGNLDPVWLRYTDVSQYAWLSLRPLLLLPRSFSYSLSRPPSPVLPGGL